MNPAVIAIITLLASALTGGLAFWLASRRAIKTEAELELLKIELDKSKRDALVSADTIDSMEQSLTDEKIRAGKLETEKGALEKRIERLELDHSEICQKLEISADKEKSLLATNSKAQADLAASEKARDTSKTELEQTKQSKEEFQSRNSDLAAKLKEAQTALSEKAETFGALKLAWERRETELKADAATATEKAETLQAENTNLKTKNQEFTTSLEKKQEHFDEQLKLLQENKAELTKQFETLANEILDKKGRAFGELNKESMTNILSPIQAELKGFKEKVENIHTQETEQRTKLRTELENLQKLNQAITEQAGKLTTALRGQKKVQGNWGELMLENVLDNSGLRLGSDYKREDSFNTEEGRLRPDAVVYLPQGKHLIIDAKTSLNAYTEYVNADDELQRTAALAQHTSAVGDRINELSNKSYFNIPGLNSPEVVIMFIPIESAYVEALKSDDTLFQRALEKNVLVATPTTLLTSLNIVRQLWRFEDQNKHTAELAERAAKFYNQLRLFLESMGEVDKQLDKAKSSFGEAMKRLHTGRGNLIKRASEFKELGVSVQKELPAPLVEKAELELLSAELSELEIEAETT
ncbi:DNA recombination protein RmuC [Ferrimonas sediminum]|uniref:DNA recombination protein RmuC n=1 Tax=Ferrimonas sediminum TaxID=718193 RepID=A0A1G8UWZ4_9GAMM|nr:DNA recombination protein RmuC [Ferrimonas sediminum]SDJ58382.1 DNA recombination protein RmuC [Ferrimonas sediminum]